MTAFRIRFEGPSLLAMQVARELAEAKGVDLTASQPPTPVGPGRSRLELTLEGDDDRVLDAVEQIRESLDDDASVELLAD